MSFFSVLYELFKILFSPVLLNNSYIVVPGQKWVTENTAF